MFADPCKNRMCRFNDVQIFSTTQWQNYAGREPNFCSKVSMSKFFITLPLKTYFFRTTTPPKSLFLLFYKCVKIAEDIKKLKTKAFKYQPYPQIIFFKVVKPLQKNYFKNYLWFFFMFPLVKTQLSQSQKNIKFS